MLNSFFFISSRGGTSSILNLLHSACRVCNNKSNLISWKAAPLNFHFPYHTSKPCLLQLWNRSNCKIFLVWKWGNYLANRFLKLILLTSRKSSNSIFKTFNTHMNSKPLITHQFTQVSKYDQYLHLYFIYFMSKKVLYHN